MLNSKVNFRKNQRFPRNIQKYFYEFILSQEITLFRTYRFSKQTQGNSSATQSTNKIESLVTCLNELQIAKLGAQKRETITKMNDQVALSTFKNGLNELHRATVLAARPKSPNEAIQLASEVIPQQNSIMHFNKNKRPFNNREQRSYANTYNKNRSSNRLWLL